MDPTTFDCLVEKLEVASVFYNQLTYPQMPVYKKVYITLKRLGVYRNSMALNEIADWAGVGYGTVDLVIRRVITAVFKTNLRARHIRWPSGEEKTQAKDWIETATTSAFQKGWCMVDGTTIPIFEKPHYYRQAFYDRKSLYSINAQIINTPNRQIIDYATGFNGSRHDTHCFRSTKLGKNPQDLLPNGE